MSEPRSFASLGPTLLARKGGAKPAMRSRSGDAGHSALATQFVDEDLDDLGWNDMGEDEQVILHQAEIVTLTPATAKDQGNMQDFSDDDVPEMKQARRKGAPQRRSAVDDGRRAAFTLRLDAERHLKLRLASTIKNRSAQTLVTRALDQFFAEIPEIEALAAQVKRNANRPKGV